MIGRYFSRSKRTTENKVVYRCSFCAKPQDEVRKLIADPAGSVYICNECVAQCQEIIGASQPMLEAPAAGLTLETPAAEPTRRKRRHKPLRPSRPLQRVVPSPRAVRRRRTGVSGDAPPNGAHTSDAASDAATNGALTNGAGANGVHANGHARETPAVDPALIH